MLMFKITQHSRDANLMKSFCELLDCGRYADRLGYNHGEFIVSNLPDLNKKIIPFFDKYPIQGVKALDFADFKRVA
jgi:LAGLIDADG endonuclease